MRFLIDEMFGPDVVDRLCSSGHEAVGVRDLDLAGKDDAAVLARAVRDDRILVTENAADFVPLLDERAAAGERLVPVLVALKRTSHAARVPWPMRWVVASTSGARRTRTPTGTRIGCRSRRSDRAGSLPSAVRGA